MVGALLGLAMVGALLLLLAPLLLLFVVVLQRHGTVVAMKAGDGDVGGDVLLPLPTKLPWCSSANLRTF